MPVQAVLQCRTKSLATSGITSLKSSAAYWEEYHSWVANRVALSIESHLDEMLEFDRAERRAERRAARTLEQPDRSMEEVPGSLEEESGSDTSFSLNPAFNPVFSSIDSSAAADPILDSNRSGLCGEAVPGPVKHRKSRGHAALFRLKKCLL
jgi:hypothetical protein